MAIQPISTSNLDADSDSPRLARQQLFDTVNLINEVIADARIAFSQNPVVLPVNTGGTPDYSGASVQCRVFRFVQDETPLWTFTASGTDCTFSLGSGGMISISNSAKDAAYIDVTASRSGYSDVYGRVSVFRNASLATPSAPDITPPPTPSNFSAVPGINTVHLLWDAPTYLYGRGNDHTNVYGAIWDGVSALPVFTSSSVLKRSTVLGYITVSDIPSEPATKWCLWITFQSKDGIESVIPAGGLHGVQVETGLDPSKLLAILHAQITPSELNTYLGAQIGLISASSSTAGSVAYQVAAEATTRAAAVSQEVIDRNTAVGVETSNRVSAITALNGVKNRIFYSATTPASDVNYTLNTNDTWFDTSNNNKEYRWNGTTWVLGGDLRLATAVTDISNETTQRVSGQTAEANVRTALYAGVTAGTGNDYKIFNQSAQPTGTTIGDVWTWIDGTGTTTFKRWSGSTWVDSSGNQRAAYYRGAYADQTAINGLTSNVIGDLARRISDNVLLVWQGSAWVTVSTPTSFQYAFLDQEATARTTADASEASLRSTLATQMRGSYTGTDPASASLTSGLFYNEVLLRSAADSTEASLRSDLSTQLRGSYTGTDAGSASLTSGLIYSEAQLRSSGDSTEATLRTNLATQMRGSYTGTDPNSSSLTSGLFYNEVLLRSGADATEAGLRSTLATQLRGAYTGTDPTQLTSGSLFYNEVQLRSSGDSTEATLRTNLATQVRGTYTGTDITQATSGSMFYNEVQARSQADDTELTARQFLSTRLTGHSDPTGLTIGDLSVGLLYEESHLRSAADISQVNRISAVETSLASGGTTYNSIASVNTTATSKNANFVQSTAPTATKVGDTWIDTSSGRLLKTWNGSAWVASDDTRIGASASQITTLQSSILNGAAADFEGLQTWDFTNTADGWGLINASYSLGASAFTVTPTSGDVNLLSPTIAITGALYDKIRARVYRVSGSGWDGIVFYATSGHSCTASFYKSIPDTTVIGQWVTLEWDMSALTVGGTDWLTNTIIQLRVDFGTTTSDVFIIDWISIGKRGAGTAYATVQQEISTRASETGYLGGKYYVRTQVTADGKTVMGGFGIEGTSAPGQQATIDFGVQANKFWIGAPSTSSGVSSVQPFIVKTTVTVDANTGVTIPVGVYMDSAYITNLTALWANFGTLIATSITTTSLNASQLTAGTGVIGGQLRSTNYVAATSGWVLKPDGTCQIPSAYILGTLTANQINSNGLTIRNASGSVILDASGGAPAAIVTDLSNAPSSIKNSNITLASDGTLSGGATGTQKVTIGGLGYIGSLTATDGAQAGVNLKDNAGSILGDAAIKNAGITLSAGGVLSGAGGGTVTPVGIGAVKTDGTNAPASLLNSSVTINANGTLSNAGGGSVTPVGISAVATDLSNAPTTIKNVSISINADGTLSNAGGGAVTPVGISAVHTNLSNAPAAIKNVNITVNADGTINNAGGGAVTPVGIGAIKTDASNAPASIKNTSITLNADGTINNAGGGGVTIGGLGYTGNLNATSDITLINGANCTIVGNSITSGGTGGWGNSGAFSKEGYTGGAFASAVVTSGTCMFGLNNDTAGDLLNDNNYTTIKYALYYDGGTNMYPFREGSSIGGPYTMTTGNLCAVTYDGVNARWYINGQLKFTYLEGYVGPLYFDSAFIAAGAHLDAIKFGPMSSNAWNAIGAPANLAGLSGGEPILNTSISISAGGVLSGAGGGTVTPVGIGAIKTDASNAPGTVLNSSITVNADGTINNAGGGAVTPVGIGAIKTDASNAPGTVLNSSITLGTTGNLLGAGGGQLETTPVLDRERETNRPPNWYPVGTTKDFKHAAAIGLNDGYGYWVTLETIKQYGDSQGGFPGYQYCYQQDHTWRRAATDDSGSAWTAWAQDLDTHAYTGDLNASADLQLINSQNCLIRGNTITSAPNTNGWGTAGAYSLEGYMTGAFVSGIVNRVGDFMFGLNEDPTLNDSYSSIKFACYQAGGNFYGWHEGSGVFGPIAIPFDGSVLAVTYNGVKAIWYLNGAYAGEYAEVSAAPMYFDSAFAQANLYLSGIKFGPMSSGQWANVGGPNKPQDNATVGAPNGTYVGANLAQTVESWSYSGYLANLSVNDATSGLAKRLLASGDVLRGIYTMDTVSAPSGFKTGTITWNTSGAYTGGYGVAFTPKGILGYNTSNNPTFVIDATTGDATFGGTLTANIVTTSNLQAGSVTAAAGAELTADLDVSGNTWQQVLVCAAVDTAGGPLNIYCGWNVYSFTAGVLVDIRVNGSSVKQFNLNYVNYYTGFGGNMMTDSRLVYLNSPGTGSLEVSMYIQGTAPGAYTIAQPSHGGKNGTFLSLNGFKR
jgi:hypothetical protein